MDYFDDLQGDRLRRFYCALAKLPEEQRMYVELRQAARSDDEIAVVLRMSAERVKVVRQRALDELRALMNDPGT